MRENGTAGSLAGENKAKLRDGRFVLFKGLVGLRLAGLELVSGRVRSLTANKGVSLP